jgi:hypothetical protein
MITLQCQYDPYAHTLIPSVLILILILVQATGHNYGLPLDGISVHLMQFERG